VIPNNEKKEYFNERRSDKSIQASLSAGLTKATELKRAIKENSPYKGKKFQQTYLKLELTQM